MKNFSFKYDGPLLGLALTFFILVGLGGCDNSDYARTVDISSYYKLTDNLKGCTVNKATSVKYNDLYVVSCEDKKTSTVNEFHSKRQPTLVININGVEYEATPKEKQE